MASSNKTSLYDDMPKLEDVDGSTSDDWVQSEDEGTNRFRIGSVLAQIELLSCFWNISGPLFELLDSELWRAARL